MAARKAPPQTDDYFSGCRARIAPALAQDFSFAKCLAIQKRHLALDLFLGLINALWAIPHASIKKALEVGEKLGWEPATRLLPKIPAAFKTGFQRETEAKLLESVFQIDSLSAERQMEIRSAISEYSLKQNALVDISVAGCVILVSEIAFGDRSLDIFGIGSKIASHWAKDRAENQFFLGKTIGHAFYQIAPAPAATTSQILASTAVCLLALALLSTVLNVSSWPLQRKLGLRQKQLEQLIEKMEER